jgi:DNA-binding NarL/FixJ family response regulator
MIDLAIIDDDLLLLQDLDKQFKNESDIHLRWAGNDLQEFLEQAVYKTDVLLLDIMLHDSLMGYDFIEAIKSKNSRIQIIMFSVMEELGILLKCIKKGADGYILKDANLAELISSIKCTYQGGANLSPMMARKLLEMFSVQNTENKKWGALLNETEYMILKHLSEGMSYKIISDKANITIDSLRYNIKSLYKKMHVNSKGEAIRLFLQE